jgi:hypothetical protein
LTNYCFSDERPAQVIFHDLTNEERNENVAVTSSQSRQNNSTIIKRKNDMQNIDNKRRKTEGKSIVTFFLTSNERHSLKEAFIITPHECAWFIIFETGHYCMF